MTLPDRGLQAAKNVNSIIADPVGAAMQAGSSISNAQDSPLPGASDGIDLQKLAERIVEKLRREIGLENERTGRG